MCVCEPFQELILVILQFSQLLLEVFHTFHHDIIIPNHLHIFVTSLLVFGALAVTIPQEVHNLGDDSESLVEMEAREGRFREFTRCTLCRHFLHPAP